MMVFNKPMYSYSVKSTVNYMKIIDKDYVSAVNVMFVDNQILSVVL